jgi:hypothetical protein
MGMTANVQVPVEVMEEVAALRLPARADQHLQSLMDRNNEGRLSAEEQQELEGLVELSEAISLLRAKAMRYLGRKPV